MTKFRIWTPLIFMVLLSFFVNSANAGATLNDVVQVTVFLRDASDRDKHAEIRARYFKEKPPASTLVGTDFIFKEMLVEINAIAAI